MEALGRLAAGITHDINTPIQFIGDSVHFLADGVTDLLRLVTLYERLEALVDSTTLDSTSELLAEIASLRDKADLDFLREELPSAFLRISSGVERVAGIVGAMRDFARQDTSEKTPSDINKSIENSLILAENEYKYIAKVESNFGVLPTVHCHAGALGRVWLNLIVNAAHAIGSVSRSANELGIISIVTRASGSEIEVEISDTGSGMPAHVRARVFEPFFTTKAIGKGTGQGLALAKHVVEEGHGGTIDIDSTVGMGTRIVVRLPLAGSESG